MYTIVRLGVSREDLLGLKPYFMQAENEKTKNIIYNDN